MTSSKERLERPALGSWHLPRDLGSLYSFCFADESPKILQSQFGDGKETRMANIDVEERQAYDLIVIGAGIYGIQAARTYLELNPKADLVILEASGSIGGVWSRERVYEDFWTQTPLGILEFSDQPMHDIPEDDRHHGFFKAMHVTEYLEKYCESRMYEGSSLPSRIRFESPVSEVFKADEAWNVRCGNTVYRARQLIDASGLTSAPNWPKLPRLDCYKGQVLHHKDFRAFEQRPKDPDSKKPQTVAVIGGAKSAADIVYSCAKAGLDVTWIIRRSGSGPAAFVSVKGQLGYANSNESFYTRLTSLFLVSIFSAATGYEWIHKWLHRSWMGRTLVSRVWKRVHNKACREANYDREDGAANGFHNLKPDTEIFWQNDSTGVNQREDFFDVIATKVKVFREDISSLDEHSVVLADADKTKVRADITFCATGWKTTCSHFDEATSASLGLAVDEHALDASSRARWSQLDSVAETAVLEQYPILDSEWAHQQPAYALDRETTQTPFRLWKSMVPPSDPSVVFLGRVMLGNHFRNAEVQALFACAVFECTAKRSSRVFSLPAREAMNEDIAKVNAWCRRRYLRKGLSGNWFYWDMIPYTDMLLAQLGLGSHRGKTVTADLTRPGFAKDLARLIDEHKARTRVHAS